MNIKKLKNKIKELKCESSHIYRSIGYEDAIKDVLSILDQESKKDKIDYLLERAEEKFHKGKKLLNGYNLVSMLITSDIMKDFKYYCEVFKISIDDLVTKLVQEELQNKHKDLELPEHMHGNIQFYSLSIILPKDSVDKIFKEANRRGKYEDWMVLALCVKGIEKLKQKYPKDCDILDIKLLGGK
jgi:hypothetical protein